MSKRIRVYDAKNCETVLGLAETSPDGTITFRVKVEQIMNLDKRLLDYDDLIGFTLGFYFHVPEVRTTESLSQERETACEGCKSGFCLNPECTKEVKTDGKREPGGIRQTY